MYLKRINKLFFILKFSFFLLQKKNRYFKTMNVLIRQMMLFSVRAREGRILRHRAAKLRNIEVRMPLEPGIGSDIPNEVVMDMEVQNQARMLKL